MFRIVAVVIVSGVLALMPRASGGALWAQAEAALRADGPALVTLDDPVRPSDGLFAEVYDILPPPSEGFDPLAAQAGAFKRTAADFPSVASDINETLQALLASPRPNEASWPSNIDPFYWVSHLTGKCPTGPHGAGDAWWNDFHRNPKHFYAEMLPFLIDPRTSSPNPLRAKARRMNNEAIADLIAHGRIRESANRLLAAAAIDDTYTYPLYNAGIVLASGMESKDWRFALHTFDRFRARRIAELKRTPDAKSDRLVGAWVDSIRKMLALSDVDSASGFPSHVYLEDIRAAVVLLQAGQYRAAVSLAAQANSMFDQYAKGGDANCDRPYAYLVGALAASLGGNDTLAIKLVARGASHAFLADENATANCYREIR